METNLKPEQEIIFREPRLTTGAASRFLIRLIAYSSYTILIAVTAAFLIFFWSDLTWLFWLGVLFALFLADRLIHFGQAERTLAEIKIDAGKIINIADYISPGSLGLLERAYDRTLFTDGNFYLCLLKFLLKEKDINQGLLRMDVAQKEIEQKIDDSLKNVQKSSQPSHKDRKKELSSQLENLTKIAFSLAYESGEKFIEPRTYFSALARANDESVNRIFNLFDIDAEDLENALIFGRFHQRFSWLKRLPTSLGGFAHRPYELRHRIMNRAWTARPTPTLDKFSLDFTDLAREEAVGLLIGHEKEYDRLLDILSRPSKANALLVGEPGSGKETLVAHLAFEIIKDKVPAPLFDKRLVALQIGNLISGATPDEVSRRVNAIIGEIVRAGNIVLYIPDIHNLVKTSGEGFLSAADILIPVIVSDAFPVVGATYPKESKELIETQSDFASAFDVIRIEEIDEGDAIKVLTYESMLLERQYGVLISFGAIKEAVVLAHKYFHYKLLPGSAEELLKEALADVSQKGEKVLKVENIVSIAERKTNIPIHRAGKEEAKKLLNLESIIHEKLIDQEEAVSAVSRSLREYRSGLSRGKGPIAVFLFVGPTGVGKTELSKILTKIQFGSETMMIRFDMSEYQDKTSISRFIGSPDGRIAGNLTESVIQKPYSLILLDEFEKAHPDILNLFLQVFDDGRLTDNLGRTIDFTNTIIIATSNAHSEFIKTHIEAHTPMETIAEELKKKLTDYFRPELLNRFSSIIVFKTLSPQNIESIAKLQLLDLAQTVSEAQGITLTFNDAVVKKIAELGYSPAFGARPLRGVISEKLRSVLAEKILKGDIAKGDNIKISLNTNSELQFSQGI